MNRSIEEWVELLGLTPHPEGGFFKEVYRSKGVIGHSVLPKEFGGDRNYVTNIYFLLTSESFSSLHRLAADELWHFLDGDSLTVSMISPDGELSKLKIGRSIEAGEVLQGVVPAGYWFGASVDQENAYALVGCTVAPGFDFQDFELAQRDTLIERYPQHRQVIESLTR